MSIKNWNGASSRWTLLGDIKIGTKVKRADGVEYPKALDYFLCPPEVLDATVALAEERGDTENLARARQGKPITLYVTVPFGSVDRILPHYYKFYGSSAGLKCLGDGEWILRRAGDADSDPPGIINGRSMLTLHSEPCDRTTCPHAQASKRPYRDEQMVVPAPCQPRGYLHFLVWNVFRTGVYRLKMSKLAIQQALGQFALAERLFRHIDGLPYLLHLTQRMEQTPNGMKPLYIPWLEVDPIFIEQNIVSMRRTMLAPPGPSALPEDTYTLQLPGEHTDEPDDEEPLTAAEAAADLFGDWEQSVLQPDEIEPEPAPAALGEEPTWLQELREQGLSGSMDAPSATQLQCLRVAFARILPDLNYQAAMLQIWGDPDPPTVGQVIASQNWLASSNGLTEQVRAELAMLLS